MKARHLAALGCGTLFGLGLSISQMANPAKVLGFLDITGAWDPSLLLVLGGAVLVTAIAFRFIPGRMTRPLYDTTFEKPPIERFDARILVGAGLFGIGWGLGGYCPGPSITALARLAPDAFVFVAFFLAGSLAYRVTTAKAQIRDDKNFA